MKNIDFENLKKLNQLIIENAKKADELVVAAKALLEISRPLAAAIPKQKQEKEFEIGFWETQYGKVTVNAKNKVIARNKVDKAIYEGTLEKLNPTATNRDWGTI